MISDLTLSLARYEFDSDSDGPQQKQVADYSCGVFFDVFSILLLEVLSLGFFLVGFSS